MRRVRDRRIRQTKDRQALKMKYKKLLASLEKKGEGRMTVFGNSMMPVLESGTTLFYYRTDTYNVGDIVFCKVRGRYIDAHKIIKVRMQSGKRQYLIANNAGHENGWTSTVYGKVILTPADLRAYQERVSGG